MVELCEGGIECLRLDGFIYHAETICQETSQRLPTFGPQPFQGAAETLRELVPYFKGFTRQGLWQT